MWHNRFCHVGVDNLKKVTKTVDGLPPLDGDLRVGCRGCTSGKLTKVPTIMHNTIGTTESLELVHSNVCGPINSSLWGGAKYFCTFIDDLSRKASVNVLSNKQEVFDRFRAFIALAERTNGNNVKCLK